MGPISGVMTTCILADLILPLLHGSLVTPRARSERVGGQPAYFQVNLYCILGDHMVISSIQSVSSSSA